MEFDIYVQLKCPKCGEVRDNPVAAPDYTGQWVRNLISAVGIGEPCERCAAARAPAYLGAPPHPPREDLRALTLPCPFCGRTDMIGIEPHPESCFRCIRCRACGAIGPAGRSLDGDPMGDHEATAHWNRRALAAAAAPSPTDLDNLKLIRRAVNRTAYHGGLGLHESGQMLGTLDRLLAAYGVGPDDGPSLDEVKVAQSIPERRGWPR